LKKR